MKITSCIHQTSSKILKFFTICFSIHYADCCSSPGQISKLTSFRAIMTMDARDQFPVDMVEQMLKFTPSPEERALLDEHADEIDHLARADRFLFELSKYEQLECYISVVTLFFQDNTL